MMKFSRNDIKISFGEPVFYVNEAKRTIVCKMDAVFNLPEYDASFAFFGPAIDVDQHIPSIGVARCSEDDVFDEARGKNIAFAKAENDAYRKAYEKINDAVKTIEWLCDMCYDFSDKATKCINHNIDYVDKLSNVDNPDYISEVYEPKEGETFYSTKKKKE